MERLFDPERPYFEAWVRLHNADDTTHLEDRVDREHEARPLCYAASFGFLEIVEHLILKRICRVQVREVVVMGLRYTRHRLQVISRSYDHWPDSLLRHGVYVGVDAQNYANRTPVRLSSQSGHHDVVQCIIDHDADMNSQEDDHNTPLNKATHGGHVDVVRVLHDSYGRTPLHDIMARGDNPKADYP
ncbi:ankyrin repeat-containing domain protein [Lactarius hatsudake]|nr:ankyrin repeat-containing domain protein [Lactarius hatsudake]